MKYLRLKEWLVIGVCTPVIVFITAILPSEVLVRDQLSAVQFGWPFPYMVQNLSRYDPPSYPYSATFGSPWEDPFKILGANLFFTMFFWATVLLALILSTKILYYSLGRRVQY